MSFLSKLRDLIHEETGAETIECPRGWGQVLFPLSFTIVFPGFWVSRVCPISGAESCATCTYATNPDAFRLEEHLHKLNELGRSGALSAMEHEQRRSALIALHPTPDPGEGFRTAAWILGPLGGLLAAAGLPLALTLHPAFWVAAGAGGVLLALCTSFAGLSRRKTTLGRGTMLDLEIASAREAMLDQTGAAESPAKALSSGGTSSEKLIQANIKNLTAFWAACGMMNHSLHGGGTLHSSVNWPGRMWFDYDHHPDGQDLEQLLSQAERAEASMMIPQWHEDDEFMREALGQAGFELRMTQEAMVVSLEAMEAYPDSALKLRWVTDAESIHQWTQIASESFGYDIHEPVVAGLVGAPGFHLVVADVGSTVVATGMLLQTGQTAGLHMVGVPPARRRQGYARQIMFGLLGLARELGCKQATLQASAAGKPLYEQLGFKGQGTIRTYRRDRS